MKAKKATFIRTMRLNPTFWGEKACKQLIGNQKLPEGVLCEQEVEYSDPRGKGFNNPMFEMQSYFDGEEWLKSAFIVELKRKK
jgi:hypothetical protein